MHSAWARTWAWPVHDVPARAFPGYPGSIPAARDYIVAMLDDQPGELRETVAVLVSELVTNAVRHGSGRDFEVSVEHRPDEGRLWVGVTDSGSGNPMVRTPPVTAEHGRGLQLVGLLANRWGVRRRHDDHAKTVWFELTGAGTSTQPHAPGRQAAESAGRTGPRRSPSGLQSPPGRSAGHSSAPGRPRPLAGRARSENRSPLAARPGASTVLNRWRNDAGRFRESAGLPTPT